MQRLAIEDALQILLHCFPVIGVQQTEKGLPNETLGLILEMTGENGVEVDELQVGGEKGPICIWRTSVNARRVAE